MVVVLVVKRSLLSSYISWRFVLGGLILFYVLLDFDVLVYSDCCQGWCTALVVGSDDVAPSYSVGVLTRRQIRRREGSRGARVVASY